ncbi:MAG: RNA polymerase sigma factor [Anaerolineae bacterium]
MGPALDHPTGDEEHFAAIFQQYKNLVYKTAYLMLDDVGEAEDALQEIFLQVHKALSTFDPEKGAFTTWLYRIAVNHCLSRRRNRRLFTVPLDRVAPSSPAEFPPDYRSVEDEETLRQALGRLSEKLRAVVILRYYLDLPYAEIAQVLDIPVGTVKSRLNLALRTLRRELDSLEGNIPTARHVPSPREVAE